MANHNFQFRNVNHALPVLSELLLNQPEVASRAGTTRELTQVSITLTNPLEREVLLPERKASLAAQVAETMWVLAGRNDIGWLSRYLPRAGEFSDNGKTWRAGYGPRLRHQHLTSSDPLWDVVQLLRRDPGTRQAVISIWDRETDGPALRAGSKDIPCNNWLHFLQRGGALDLHVATRSNDLIWGWSGINQYEWSALLQLVAELAGMRVGRLHFSISSLHLYERHYAKAQALAEAGPVTTMWTEQQPAFGFTRGTTLQELNTDLGAWFDQEAAVRRGQTVRDIKDNLLGCWLNVVALQEGAVLHVGPHERFPGHLETALDVGAGGRKGAILRMHPPRQGVDGAKASSAWLDEPYQRTKASRAREASQASQEPRMTRDEVIASRAAALANGLAQGLPPAMQRTAAFRDEVVKLHVEKDAAYGDSWCKRGELFSIVPNIARKVDRLASGLDTTDETQVDTAIDLWVYAIKYRAWLRGATRVGQVNSALRTLPLTNYGLNTSDAELVRQAGKLLNELTEHLQQPNPARDATKEIVWHLCCVAGQLAFTRWLSAREVTTEAVNQ